MKTIDIQSIKKIYHGVTVLDVPALTINQGSITAIIGKNGSGKTTLLKLIAGLLYPTEGTVSIFNIASTAKQMQEYCKLVLESGSGYYDYLTAWENITYFLGLNKLWIKNIQEKLTSLLKQFNFMQHIHKKVSELSQGNRQKLAIIIALLTEPRILCLDEPTNGLDVNAANLLLNNLKQIALNCGTTIVFTTHDLLFMKSIDARIIVLKNGFITYDGKLMQFKENQLDKTVFTFSETQIDTLNTLCVENCRTEYSEGKVFLHVYDTKTKTIILNTLEIEEMHHQVMEIEDLFFTVMKDV